MKTKFRNISKVLLAIIISINIIIILTTCVFSITTEVPSIVIFDIFVCLVIFIDFLKGYLGSSNRLVYIKQNWLELLAFIPFDLILSPFLGFEYLVVIKVIRILLLLLVLFQFAGEFLKNTRLDEIIGLVAVIIIGSTVGLYLVDPSMNNLFDNLWFVIVSITTVGYGDITPTTVYGKVLSLILLIIGVFIFSAITGAIASYFMDNLLQEGTYHIHDLKEKVESSQVEMEKLNEQLKESDKKIDELKKEIKELKEIIEKNN